MQIDVRGEPTEADLDQFLDQVAAALVALAADQVLELADEQTQQQAA